MVSLKLVKLRCLSVVVCGSLIAAGCSTTYYPHTRFERHFYEPQQSKKFAIYHDLSLKRSGSGFRLQATPVCDIYGTGDYHVDTFERGKKSTGNAVLSLLGGLVLTGLGGFLIVGSSTSERSPTIDRVGWMALGVGGGSVGVLGVVEGLSGLFADTYKEKKLWRATHKFAQLKSADEIAPEDQALPCESVVEEAYAKVHVTYQGADFEYKTTEYLNLRDVSSDFAGLAQELSNACGIPISVTAQLEYKGDTPSEIRSYRRNFVSTSVAKAGTGTEDLTVERAAEVFPQHFDSSTLELGEDGSSKIVRSGGSLISFSFHPQVSGIEALPKLKAKGGELLKIGLQCSSRNRESRLDKCREIVEAAHGAECRDKCTNESESARCVESHRECEVALRQYIGCQGKVSNRVVQRCDKRCVRPLESEACEAEYEVCLASMAAIGKDSVSECSPKQAECLRKAGQDEEGTSVCKKQCLDEGFVTACGEQKTKAACAAAELGCLRAVGQGPEQLKTCRGDCLQGIFETQCHQ